ncbi:helix-turn-helix transcriptional regulator [Streptacidiphilus sp. PB12-B1b]|uniref:AraC family transcriptional regulator n=1 Tax=Streptacidiphilus sp. PB12-B1b TaxID=2705012 RepID=UPI0015FE75B6|nr:helix-turn-helix transcriptional regulator [Streptacidiphilus sp. PB12-B1b]QMU77675.1 helix-turn-helix transcriptional regulator [Streptacidiphilus sp. PB12-B1b]
MPVDRHPLHGPTLASLVHRERVDWHDHAVHQLIHPSAGVLQVSTPIGAWIVPPYRAVWIPAEVPHAHQAHGPTHMRTLAFAATVNPLRLDRPTVLAVTPLLREVIVSLTGDDSLTSAQRENLERVALDQLYRVEALPLCLPSPADDRLRHVHALLSEDPADQRTLAELGAAVGASERTLSRLFRSETAMSFPQWRTQLRLHHSLTLLAAGRPVTAVATACGYSSSSAFIEAFRHAFGSTPGKYRREGTDRR